MAVILRAALLAAIVAGQDNSGWQPSVLWSRELGEGYAGLAVAGSRLVTMYRRGDDEVIVALDRETGKTLWEHAYAAPPLEGQDLSQGVGPHATPLVAPEGAVCAAGVTGRLTCLDIVTGRVRWTKELITGLGGTVVYRGYSSTPVAHRDMVIAAVGGTGRAAIAFDARSGKELWRGGSYANTNSTPVLITGGEQPQLILFMVDAVAAIDPENGHEIWTHSHPQQYDDNISPPLWFQDDGLLVVSSALDGGTRALEVEREGVRERWHQPRLGLYYTNFVSAGRVLAGSSGGATTSIYTAVDRNTGAVLWQSRDVARANGARVDGRLVLRDELGGLLLARLDEKGVTVDRRAQVLEPGAPSPPAVDGRRIYIRDRKRAVAIDLAPELTAKPIERSNRE